VAASGNSGFTTSVNFPASFPGVIAVGSINNANSLSNFSATGKALDVVAPGEDVFGTVPSTVTLAGANENDGTSFSAPQVAGVAALIRSVNPGLSWQKVTQYIDFTATDLGATGFDNSFGFGRLNAGAAVTAANNGTVFISNPAEPGESFPYPNPFRPGPGREVVIALPASLGAEGIEIDIMNLAGEKVRTLSGTNTWDGRGDGGDLVASGLYFYFAKTSRGDAKGKLTLIK
jgi:subtilisin family serine protease